MKRMAMVLIVFNLAALLMGGAARAAQVAQGKCLAYDETTRQIQLEEYDTRFTPENRYGAPTGVTVVFDVTGAKIGIPPQPGDILRIAYEVDGSQRRALKVMNVSKQDLRKK